MHSEENRTIKYLYLIRNNVYNLIFFIDDVIYLNWKSMVLFLFFICVYFRNKNKNNNNHLKLYSI